MSVLREWAGTQKTFRLEGLDERNGLFLA